MIKKLKPRIALFKSGLGLLALRDDASDVFGLDISEHGETAYHI